MGDLELRPCHRCGAPCDWCAGANRARKAFPRATKTPRHDAEHDTPEEHHCVPCFMKVAEAVRCSTERELDKS